MTSTGRCKIRSRQTGRMWPAECRILPPRPVQRTLTRPLPRMGGCGLQRDRFRVRRRSGLQIYARGNQNCQHGRRIRKRRRRDRTLRQMPPESEPCVAGSCGHRASVRAHLSPGCPSPTRDTAGHAGYGHSGEQYRKEAVRHRPYNRGRRTRRASVQGARGDRKGGSGPASGSLPVGRQGAARCRRAEGRESQIQE